MQADNPMGVSQKGLESYVHSLFLKFDEDNSNSIDSEEFRALCTDLGYFFGEEEEKEIFSIVDDDNSGVIEFPEFMEFWKSSGKFKITDKKKLDLYISAVNEFRKYDLDGNGKITLDEYQQLYSGSTVEQLKDCIAKIDTDGDGEISFSEFVAWLNWNL